MSLKKSGGARLRVILATALVVGLVGVAPAGAVVDTSFTCPDSIESAGFADIGGHDQTTQRAIDCLAGFGITRGTGPDTFEPGSTVPRWQMALFLVRQSAAYGVTIPEAVDQGFEDLDGLSVEARDAVNQLGQLGITLGTSDTTFSPHDDVTRWQMALFITRLLAGSGIALPVATDQGFADLDGLSAQAQDAIDQLSTLGIAAGTSATTFSPFAETLRWHMALFLTRALAVAGIHPNAGLVTVTPSTHAFLDYSGSAVSRQYTAAVSMKGPFTVELWPVSLIRADGSFEAPSPGAIANCDITLVDGGFHSADKVTGIEPNGTTFTFTVGCTGLQSGIVPVVYSGSSLDGLDGATETAAKTPANAHGHGGGITVVAEATAETFGPVAVESIDKKANSFTSGDTTYFWDSGDTFKIDGVVVTMAEWEAALTTGDDMVAGSVYDPGGTSIFDLQDDSPVAPGLSLVAVTSMTATLTYTAAAGSDHVKVYSCEGSGCATSTEIRSVVNGTDDDPATAGTQLVITGLTAATDYDFQATQIEDTNESPKSTAVDVNTPVAISIMSVAVHDTNDGTDGWTYLFVTFDKDIGLGAESVLSDFQIHVASQPLSPFFAVRSPSRPTGTTDQLAISFEYQLDTEPDTDWVFTITEGALDVGAGGDPNGLLTAAFSH